MAVTLQCWRCGAGLEQLSLPLGRLDECPACAVQLHVCRMCQNFDPRVNKRCTEDDADEVRIKEQANFCDYFKPSPDAHNPAFNRADSQANAQLDALFGGDANNESSAGDADDPASAADDLFK